MNGFVTIIKMNLKLLLRNKGYLCFLVILPILSVVMLNIQNINTSDAPENNYVIMELDKDSEQIFNVSSAKLNVKVYDCSQSKTSEYILEELAKTGSYRIYRYKSEPMDIGTVRDKALYSANHSVIGAVIYIPDTFETEILSGGDSNIVVLAATLDGRIELMENNLKAYLQSIYSYAELTGYDKEAMNTLLDTSMKNEMVKQTVSIEVGDTLNLNAKQLGSSSSMGYSLAFLTIGFLFSGVFIATTIIEERHNRVYNRFVLSASSLGNYGLAKLLMICMTVLMQTVVIAIAIKLFVKTDFGISFASYIFLVFCLGLIFNTLSVVIGVLTNNVLTSNYIAFLIWCISDLLAGLYFPLDAASKWWERASMLMPQRWVLKSAEMLMAGKSGVYSMFILVVISYLVVIMTVGLLGIKIKRKE